MYDDTTYQPIDQGLEPEDDRRPWLVPAGFAVLGTVILVLLLAIFLRDDTPPPPPPPPPPTGGAGSVPTTEGTDDTDEEVTEPTTVNREDSETSPFHGEVERPVVACPAYTDRDAIPVFLCDSGDMVTMVQEGLSVWGASVDVDGFFGSATEEAVIGFQLDFGLTVDGVVGAETWNTLCPYVPREIVCTPDGGDESAADTPPNGITINGQQQNLLYECQHLPFQNDQGVFDAHIQSSNFLVEDPSTGIRHVVAIWVEDGTRLLVLSNLSSASVAQTVVPSGPTVSGTVSPDEGDRVVTVNVPGPTSPCETMLVERDNGSFVAYGITDVCQTDGTTVVTLTTFWQEDSTHGYSEMNYRLDNNLADAQLRLAQELVELTSAQHDRSARNETVSGTFNDRRGSNSFFMGISQYPQGGHQCTWGQIAD